MLAERTAADDALRRDVEDLLLHHELAGGGGTLPGSHLAEEEFVPSTLGEFRVTGVLGRGGMGVVCSARRGSEPPVALKVLRPGLLSTELLARFGRESEALSRLEHPGIARLLENGTFETPAGPRPWFAMELVEGEDLRAWARHAHSLEEKLELLARICDAVDHAHAHGVVHRDLKPENVLVRADGTPCVLDFGVARLTGKDRLATAALTSTGVLVGTIRYMSPEQADSGRGEPDGRSDVYTLGVVAHELLAGLMPYDVPADSLHRALVAVLTSPPRPLPQVAGSRGRHLEAVIGRALAKSPAERYATAAELAAELRRIVAGERPRARRPRRPGAREQWLLPALLAALVAVAVLLFPGVRERVESFLPEDGATADEARVIGMLDAASRDVHGTPREPEAVRLAAARCDSALRLLASRPERAESGPLRRIAWGLAMDAHLWLGDHAFDAGEYAACIAAAESTLRIAEAGAAASPVPSPTDPDIARLAEARARSARSVMALAAGRLGLVRDPWTHQQQALAWNEAALARAEPLPPGAGLADSAEAARRDVARRLLENERGIMLARAGAILDSASLVRAGLRLLERSLADGPGAQGVRMMAPTLLRSGWAWAELARIEERPAAFDSALAYLALAVARTRGTTRGSLEANARLTLAEAWRGRARTRASRGAARADLDAALEPIARRLAEPPGALQPRYLALLRAERAGIRLDRAALEQAPALAESALADLDSALPLFSPDVQPVVVSDLEIERARAQAILWTLRGEAPLREAARAALSAADRLVPEREDPGRARRIRAALEALRGVPRGPADLWYPVASGRLTPEQFERVVRGERRGG